LHVKLEGEKKPSGNPVRKGGDKDSTKRQEVPRCFPCRAADLCQRRHSVQRRLFEHLSFRRLPGLILFHVRHVDTHDDTDPQILAGDRQPILGRHALWLFGRNLELDAALRVQLHPGVCANAVFLLLVGDEETFLAVIERGGPEGLGGR